MNPSPLLPCALAALLLAACGEGPPADPAPAGGPESSGETDATARVADDTADVTALLMADDRVGNLLHGCLKNTHYDRDLSDLVPTLLEKLRSGQADPLHRAKEELAAIGTEAIPYIENVFSQSYSNQLEFAYLQNALDVAVMTDAPEARELLTEALRHPRDTVRDLGVQGLARGRARPEDYGRLRDLIDLESNPTFRTAFATGLFAADPVRAAREYLDWVEGNEYRELWAPVLSALVLVEDEVVDQRCAELWRSAPLEAKFFLAAVAAGAGTTSAYDFLVEEASSPQVERRSRALGAFAALGDVGMLTFLLVEDDDHVVRVTAGARLLDHGDTPEIRAAFAQGMDDPDADVRALCLSRMVALGDPQAIDRALDGLTSTMQRVEESIEALGPACQQDAALAARVLETLDERFQAESHLPWTERLVTLQAISQVRTESAARYLATLGDELDEAGIQGLRGHRWLCFQIGNTGAAGRVVVEELLAEETDPLRRLDLIEAMANDRADEARPSIHAALLPIVDDESLHPLERLYAADRLVRVGPMAVVAPRLKRACLRLRDERARVAMQCLLWKWY